MPRISDRASQLPRRRNRRNVTAETCRAARSAGTTGSESAWQRSPIRPRYPSESRSGSAPCWPPALPRQTDRIMVAHHAHSPNSHDRDRSHRAPDYVTKVHSGRLRAVRPAARHPASEAVQSGTRVRHGAATHSKNVIDLTVDVDDVARFCLGRFDCACPISRSNIWPVPRTSVIKIADHLGEFKGVQVSVELARRQC